MELLFAWITNSDDIVDALRKAPLNPLSSVEAGRAGTNADPAVRAAEHAVD